MGGVFGCRVSKFLKTRITSSLLQEEPLFLRDVAAVYDEDLAHLTVCQIPGGLKEGNGFNHP